MDAWNKKRMLLKEKKNCQNTKPAFRNEKYCSRMKSSRVGIEKNLLENWTNGNRLTSRKKLENQEIHLGD